MVTIDIKAMLHRVMAEVFHENFAVAEVSSIDDARLHVCEQHVRLLHWRSVILAGRLLQKYSSRSIERIRGAHGFRATSYAGAPAYRSVGFKPEQQ
jgi:hypothetical protein